MRFFRVSLTKDLKRIWSDPAALGLSIAIPIIVGILLRLITTGGGGSPTAKLLVADHDDSFASGFLLGALGQGPLEDLIEAEAVEEEDGRARMDKGEASGLLIIPDGFGDALFNQEPTELVLVTNPAQQILPGILKETFGSLVDILNAAQSILGEALEDISMQPLPGEPTLPDNVVAQISVTINHLVARADPYLIPPAIEVETVVLEEPDQKAAEFDFGKLFFPGMFFLAIMFVCQHLSADVWQERKLGTLRRTVTTPGRLGVFFLAKISAGTLFLFVVSLAALVVGRWVLRIDLANIPLAVLWSGLSGGFLLVIFTAVQLLAGTEKGGNLLTGFIIFPLVMVGGAFFPFEVMPDWMVRVGRLTPNGWTLERLKNILSNTTDPSLLLGSAAVILAATIVLYWLSLRRLSVFARAS